MAAIDVGHEIKKKVLLSSVVGEQEANLGQLSGEILKEIVDRIPMESLATMKLLSKGWHCLISDILKSKPQPSSSTLLPGIHPGIPDCSSSSSVMEQQALTNAQQPYHEGHYVDDVSLASEAERIRTLAILEHFIPKRLFNEFKDSNESSNEGLCQWCLQKFNHASRSECPAGDLKFYPLSHFTKLVEVPVPARTKENAVGKSVQIYLPGETEDADVRELFEPFGALRRVKLRKLSHEDFVLCRAIVSFIEIDDAERAVEKLKSDGQNINWFV